MAPLGGKKRKIKRKTLANSVPGVSNKTIWIARVICTHYCVRAIKLCVLYPIHFLLKHNYDPLGDGTSERRETTPFFSRELHAPSRLSVLWTMVIQQSQVTSPNSE